MMRAADEIIDIGPYAGIHGGEVVFQGNHNKLINNKNSLTAKYLIGKMKIDVPKFRRKPKDFILIEEAFLHNLKNISVKIPLSQICVVTGVSGSGKSTWIGEYLRQLRIKYPRRKIYVYNTYCIYNRYINMH